MFGFFRTRLPSKAWIDEVTRTPANTPDLWRLEQKKSHLVFEYGECMTHMPKHEMIGGQPVCTAFTKERIPLWKTNTTLNPADTIPVAVRIPNHQPKPRIGGEIYLLGQDKIIELDKQRSNGVSFERKRVSLILPDQDQNNRQVEIKAWMYLGVEKFWRPLIDWNTKFYKGADFNTVPVFKDNRQWLNEYTYFSLQDLTDSARCFIGLNKIKNEPTNQK